MRSFWLTVGFCVMVQRHRDIQKMLRLLKDPYVSDVRWIGLHVMTWQVVLIFMVLVRPSQAAARTASARRHPVVYPILVVGHFYPFAAIENCMFQKVPGRISRTQLGPFCQSNGVCIAVLL